MNNSSTRQRRKHTSSKASSKSNHTSTRRVVVDDVDFVVPPASAITSYADAADTASVTSDSSPSGCCFDKPHASEAIVDRTTVVSIGVLVFVLAMIWPPLILLLTYICSKLIPYSFRTNDSGAARRKLYAEFTEDPSHRDAFRRIRKFVEVQESYWKNSRGMLLNTTIMSPKDREPKAVVCFCHGYTDHTSYSHRIEYQRLVKAGCVVVSIEYEGHGRSDGPLGLITDWELLVDDVTQYFGETVHARFPDLPVFLMGESMGGAVAYSVYNRMPSLFTGVVFVCPMCKISDDLLPPDYVIDFLKWLIGPAGKTTTLLGYLPIAPSSDMADLVNKLPEKGELYQCCPMNFSRHPRLATARELINVTRRINTSLQDFSAPFLVLHGLADRVTDPMLSKALYDEASSKDKSIKLYDGMWHALTSGEPDANIDQVFGDVLEWIDTRI